MTSASRTCDVLVVGGGPAGATMGWALARRGVRVAVLERTRFPREKVCGDFVEPRGLKLLDTMGCLPALETSPRLPITHVAMFLASECAYRGWIPFYGWWGGDSYRTDFIYKGKGKVIFNQKPFSSRLKVIRVYYDPKEDGF